MDSRLKEATNLEVKVKTNAPVKAIVRGFLLGYSALALVSCDQFKDPYAGVKKRARHRAVASKWRVGTAALEEENRARLKAGIRPIGERWKLVSVRNRDNSELADYYVQQGDVYEYLCDDKYGTETKVVCRDAKTGRLLADLDTYPSGRRYNNEADGPDFEHIYATFTFATRQFHLVAYMGNRRSIEQQADAEPMSPRRLNHIIDQMRR